MLRWDNKRDFFEAAYLQHILDKEGYPIVYVDEFHVSMHLMEIYNWSPVSTKAMIAVNPSSWTMSFWIAFSKRKIEGIIASSDSINKRIFRWFLEDLQIKAKRVSKGTRNPCYIFDNSSVHWNNETAEFIKSAGLKWISIPPYSPQLNACEKIIAFVKGKLKAHWIRDKPLNLSIMKRIIDQIDEKIWKGWFEASKIEIFQKLKYFNNEA